MRSLPRTAALAAALIGSLAFAGTATASTPPAATDFTRPAATRTAAPQGVKTASILSEILNGGHHRHRHHRRHYRRHHSHRHYRHRGQFRRTRPPVSHGRFHGHHHR